MKLTAALLASMLLLGGADPSCAAPTEADHEIRFWSARLTADEADAVAPTRLGSAYLQKARETGDFSCYLKAEHTLKQALERKPDHYGALVSLARAYAAQHRFPEAITTAQKAVDADPREPYGIGILGDALLETGQVERAEKLFRRLVERDQGVFALSRWGNLQLARGKNAEAARTFAKAVEAARRENLPRETQAWCRVQLGLIHFEQGDWEQAGRHYREALEAAPDSYLALEHLAELRAAEGKKEEALRLYLEVLKSTPNPEFYEAIAGVYQDLGRTDEARKALARALEGYLAAVKQGNVGYYRHLAHFYLEHRGEAAEAERWARRDLELRQDAGAYDTLAWALHHKGDSRGAWTAIKQALATGMQSAELFYHAGMIAHRKSETETARGHLKRALALNPRFEHAEEIRAVLARP
jgi:tetratricopeptide (TPR) repeat protein